MAIGLQGTKASRLAAPALDSGLWDRRVGAHPGVTASTHLSNRPHQSRPAPPCGSRGPAGPGFVGSGPISGSRCLPLIKVTKKGEKKERGRENPRGEQALPQQGSRSLQGPGPRAGQAGRLWAPRGSANLEPGPERASASLKVTQQTRQRGQWGSAGRGEPPRCPLGLLTHMLAQPRPLQTQLTGPPTVRNRGWWDLPMVTSSRVQPFSCPQLDPPDWVAAEALGGQRDKGTGGGGGVCPAALSSRAVPALLGLRRLAGGGSA